jgi:hypothetical protein
MDWAEWLCLIILPMKDMQLLFHGITIQIAVEHTYEPAKRRRQSNAQHT